MYHDPYNTRVTRIGGGPIVENYIMISGHTKELISVESTNGSKEYRYDGVEGVNQPFLVEVPGSGERLRIIPVRYNNIWSFSLSLVAFGDVFPGWLISQGVTNQVSTFVKIVLPPGSRIYREGEPQEYLIA